MARQNILFAAFFGGLSAVQVLEPSGGAWPADGKVLLRWRRSSTEASEVIARIQYGDVLNGVLYPDWEQRFAPATAGEIGREDIGELELVTGLKECGGCWIQLEAVGLPAEKWGYSTFYEGSNGPVKAEVPQDQEEEDKESEEPKEQGESNEEKEESTDNTTTPPIDNPIGNLTLGQFVDRNAEQNAETLRNIPDAVVEDLDLDQRRIDGFIDVANNEFPQSQDETNDEAENQEEQEVDEESEEANEDEQNSDNEEENGDVDTTSGVDIVEFSQVLLAVSVAASAIF